jgi:cyclomaltodextrinase
MLAPAADWPPAERLEVDPGAGNAAPLPATVTAEPIDRDVWRVRFRYHPAGVPQDVALVGSFNRWDRRATPCVGPAENGTWEAVTELATGSYQYKFLVNNDRWITDPRNPLRVPDGYGSNNSLLRLGRLAQMRMSDARPSDGRIDVAGLAHQCPEPLYIQRVTSDELAVRYRTMTNDTEQVWLSLKDKPLVEMRPATVGPLFTYWERRINVPEEGNGRTPGIRAVNYTFVLDDGIGQVTDPYTYHYTVPNQDVFETPDWTHHAVWYQVMVDRFRNGDPSERSGAKVRPWTSAWFEPSPWEGKDGQTFYENYRVRALLRRRHRRARGEVAVPEGARRQRAVPDAGVQGAVVPQVRRAELSCTSTTASARVATTKRPSAQEDLLDASTWQWTETDKRFLAFVNKAHDMGFQA